MVKKSTLIMPLAAALAALSSTGKSPAATTNTSEQPDTSASAVGSPKASDQQPNAMFSAGEDLLGLIVTTAADGTVLAQHYSHMSHSSHSSHSSHYSHYSSGY